MPLFDSIPKPATQNPSNVGNPASTGASPRYALEDHQHGWDGSDPVTPTVGDSPWTWENNTGKMARVSVSGGAGVSLSILSGQLTLGLGLSAGSQMLRPDESLRISYITAPTVRVVTF